MIAFSVQAVVTVTPDEMAQKSQWVQENLLTASNLPPFSFTYSGLSSSVLLPTWSRTQTDTILDTNRTQHVIMWTNTFLQVKCVAVEYNDYPMVEWTVYLKCIGGISTPVLQNIQGLDVTFSRTNGTEFVLNGIKGDVDAPDSYEPFRTTLGPSTVSSFAPPSYSGKSTDGANGWPYWNLQLPGGGVMLAVGWPGQWASSFTRDATTNLQIKAGQQTTQLYLDPGEEIRTPLIAMFFWRGTDVVRAQNLWRHWYMAHEIPRVNGQPPSSIGQVQGDSVVQVDGCIEQGIQPDVLWRDAGAGGTTWYPSDNGPYTGSDQWLNTGTWEVDTNVYPNGFGATSAQIHSRGAKFLLWFEPERVGNTTNSFLGTNNPAWLLSGAISTTVGAILNEGNPQVFNWLTNHFDTLIKNNGVDWYREDMNGNGPLTAWQSNDPRNRKGITENFYVQGHLAYWDALLAMNPGLRIDSCASGGRRNDLETMRRAVPLWRSDYGSTIDSDAQQCQTYGLSSWLPFAGTGTGSTNIYDKRSAYSPCFDASNWPIGVSQRVYSECRKITPIMLNGDYYPLTSYSLADNVWMAWQFDQPETGEGFVQVFRRVNSGVPSMTLQLKGLDPNKAYRVQDFDKGYVGTFSGNSLMNAGLTVQLNPKQAAILYYTNVSGISISASGTPLVGPGPLNVQFAANATAATGGALTYVWNFGDGDSSTAQNPMHTYVAGGRYPVQVTVSDGLCNSNSVQMMATVLSPGARIMNIKFPGYTRGETLTNFPALVVLNSNSTNGFAYNQMAAPGGRDLVFMNADKTQPLNYEIESWNTHGNSYVWVEVPQLTNDASIWMYWGDANLASIPALSTTNGSVWANGYAGVWHLSSGTASSAADSSPARHNGTSYNVSEVSGMIGGGASFNGANSYIDLGTGFNPMKNQQVTMSLWAYPDRGGLVMFMRGNDTAGQSYGLEWSIDNTAILFTCADKTDWITDGGATPALNWSRITGIIDGTNKYLYVNGQLKASGTFTGTFYDNVTTMPQWIGAQKRASYNYWYKGQLDEMRISSLARSSNWVWASYQTMASNTVFTSYGGIRFYTTPENPGITLSANGSPLTGFKPLAVQFTATATALSGTPVGYQWNFGDGNTSTDQNPSHIYSAEGRYTAQVAVSDSQGYTNTTVIPVTVMNSNVWSMQTTFTGYTNAETLTNFPVLVVLGTNLSGNGFSYNQVASPYGWDLVFATTNDYQPLNYEIESWNTNGDSYVWVQVPLLISNTMIQAYWGDTNLALTPASSLTNGSVWANGYVGVWHLGKTNEPVFDSTKNQTTGNISTTYGTCDLGVDGIAGNGCQFDGGYISVSAADLPGGSSPRTLSVWFKKDSDTCASPGQEIVGYGDNTVTGDRFGLWVGGNGTANLLGVEIQEAGRYFPWTWDSKWHSLAAVLPSGQDDLSGVKLYYDGVENTSATGSGPINTALDELCFAAIPNYHNGDRTYDFDGALDEIRISDVARSADWLWAENMTIVSNEMFSSYGTVTPPASLVSVWLTISHTNDTILVSWPKDIVTGAVLKESSDLHTWTNSTATIVTNGGQKVVIIVPTDTMKFYKLAY